jgi:predicted transglutaminase-like cysteine proteinase
MQKPRNFRAFLGCAGLAACIGSLATHAPAAAQTVPQTLVVTGNRQPAAPDLFGTVALPIKLSRYADGWYRSRKDASRHPLMQRLIAPARALPREAQIAYVQSAVHRTIRWMSDATEWGRHDYWASAAETLERRAGDMEDRAIVKLHALKALGFPSRDLYLTMGHDKVGGPIMVLIARLGDRHYVLDDTGGAPYLTRSRREFEPWMSFGSNKTWIHGKRIAKSGAATAAAAAGTTAAPK